MIVGAGSKKVVPAPVIRFSTDSYHTILCHVVDRVATDVLGLAVRAVHPRRGRALRRPARRARRKLLTARRALRVPRVVIIGRLDLCDSAK